NWLHALSNQSFGALLADDMGLGKTIEVLAWLLKEHQRNSKKKALLIVPASLLGNWKKEIEQFTPELTFQIIHNQPSVKKFSDTPYEKLPFLNITTYGMSIRLEHLQDHSWDFLILDEAQAIKNPLTKQAQTIKSLEAQKRLAMTGTPIENNLINLWSIFDFLNGGLLGSLQSFKEFVKNSQNDPQLLNKLQMIISPFFLRRLKSDKSIIQDLPDKIEQNDYIELSEKQKVLYHQVIDHLAESLKTDQAASPFQRSALVLKTLTQLKQICNHPDQYLGQQTYAFKDSGKFKMLKEIGESIAANHECVLVFTQFREMVEPLNRELEKIFGCKGLVLHGQTPILEREKIVKAFNDQKVYIPYMVLTVKAAGVGLNLTQANHVIHFDRWWNPAVENQATDRAYRIGQHKNVMVHKFVCLQTLEESIDKMLRSKQNLADSIIKSSSESWLTSLSDQELLDMLKLHLDDD
ncbi:MAG: DEAD/DEAH box helicase, partial [Allobaculum sp.]|nr:DEAD/DEAH box helicase [Allobaculum sp.]